MTFPFLLKRKNAQLAYSATLGLGCVPNDSVQKLAQVRICTLLAKYWLFRCILFWNGVYVQIHLIYKGGFHEVRYQVIRSQTNEWFVLCLSYTGSRVVCAKYTGVKQYYRKYFDNNYRLKEVMKKQISQLVCSTWTNKLYIWMLTTEEFIKSANI